MFVVLALDDAILLERHLRIIVSSSVIDGNQGHNTNLCGGCCPMVLAFVLGVLKTHPTGT